MSGVEGRKADMRNEFEKQLVTLHNEMIQMGSMIEKAIEQAIHALVNKDVDVARMAMESDDDIDHQEKKIENLCLKLLLHQQPVATDLRRVSSALKMVTDMERIGDQAADIAEIAISLAKSEKQADLDLIRKMAKEATVMLVGSIDAFVNNDLSQAGDVIDRDDVMDDLFLQVKSTLVDFIRKDQENGEIATDLLMIAKYFERIGDHAVNISEWVQFSITGERKQ